VGGLAGPPGGRVYGGTMKSPACWYPEYPASNFQTNQIQYANTSGPAGGLTVWSFNGRMNDPAG
jgi:hypothetical protein